MSFQPFLANSLNRECVKDERSEAARKLSRQQIPHLVIDAPHFAPVYILLSFFPNASCFRPFLQYCLPAKILFPLRRAVGVASCTAIFRPLITNRLISSILFLASDRQLLYVTTLLYDFRYSASQRASTVAKYNQSTKA